MTFFNQIKIYIIKDLLVDLLGKIKFKQFKDGIVTVQLQGSCSGCPSSIMTLKQGVQNLLCHYVPEVKSVKAI